jgi:leucyl aminopeptidase
MDAPKLLLDFATLTGAARVALGTEMPALFTNDDQLAVALQKLGRREHDPVWQMPLHAPYQRYLESKVADVSNTSSTRFGGAITAALFLSRFVSNDVTWGHLDLMAWNNDTRPGRPRGGEAMALRACFALVEKLFTEDEAEADETADEA